MADEIQAIAMPKWGMEMAEGIIGEWHIAEGAKVKAGDDLVDIETSKIVNTVSAHTGGVLRRQVAQPGETLPVGALLGVLAGKDTPEAEIDAFIDGLAGKTLDVEAEEEAAPAPAPAAAPNKTETEAKTTPTQDKPAAEPAPARKADLGKLGQGDDDSDVAATPVARRLAKEYGVNLHNVSASGRHDRVTKSDLEQAVTAAGGELIEPPAARLARKTRTAPGDDSAVRATPVARRLAKELGVSLSECRVSGDRGRVSKADVEAAAALQNRGQNQAPAGGAAGPAAEAAPAFEESPLGGMRKTIAARLQQSKQTAPHYRVQIDAELDNLLAVRRQINDSNPNAKISVNDFLIKACACALMQVPALNVQFDGETLRQFRDADIAVAVALDDGLITPIVRAANTKGLIAISNELRDLATRAKLGKLKSEEFQGGTFSLSNLGMFGIKQFDAIINPPQAAILAAGAGEQRPVIRDGQVVPATVVSLALSSDHRIIDGAVAARFMAALKQYLEQPATMLG